MVDAHSRIAVKIVDALEAVADHRRGEMTDMETLGDIDGRIIQTDCLALTDFAGTPASRILQHRFDDIARQTAAAQEHIQIAADDLDMVNLLAFDFLRQLACNHLRRTAHRLGKTEARQGIVAHLLIRRRLNHGADVLAAETALFKAAMRRLSDILRNLQFHIHIQ